MRFAHSEKYELQIEIMENKITRNERIKKYINIFLMRFHIQLLHIAFKMEAQFYFKPKLKTKMSVIRLYFLSQ